MRRALAYLLLLFGLVLGFSLPLAAQERMREFGEGDGRIHGGPTLQVSEMDLHPGQVQTINLHPRFHTIIEYPYPIARVDAGDSDVFIVSIVGNKLSLKSTQVDFSETSMSVILADADLTVVPYLVRSDSTQPMAYVVRYTDPVAKHLEAAESSIAARVEADNRVRLDRLAEARLLEALLGSSDLTPLDAEGRVAVRGGEVRVRLSSAQRLPADGGGDDLYVRYTIDNNAPADLNGLYFVVRVITHGRSWLLLESERALELFDIRDVRTEEPVPGGRSASGLLIFSAPHLAPNQSLEVEAALPGEQGAITLERVLVGR